MNDGPVKRDAPTSQILLLLHSSEVEGKLDAVPYWFSTSALSTQNYNSYSSQISTSTSTTASRVLQLQIMERARKQFSSFRCENGVLQGKLLSVSVILFRPSGVKIIEEEEVRLGSTVSRETSADPPNLAMVAEGLHS